jgi:phenylalanyl-tRNA synthetase beta chain
MSHLGTARDLRAGLLQKTELNVELITPSVSNFRDMRTLQNRCQRREDNTLAPPLWCYHIRHNSKIKLAKRSI